MSRPTSRRPAILAVFILTVFSALWPKTGFASAVENTFAKLPYSNQELFRLGEQRVFEGPRLREVAFPLGGIGTGTVSLGGRGNLRDWEIFNRPGKGVNLPFTFFALHFEPEGGPSGVRVLEGPLSPPLTGSDGFRRADVPGLPRMEKACFYGEYPFARVELEDGRV
ncbi:MAG: GH116 family glycosyl-hydrolase, partial [Acidobacteriota bacterium]